MRLLPSVRILLVLALAASTQGLLVVQSTFLLRQDVITERFCENRWDPTSDCKGRCFLEKQMADMHGAHGAGHDAAGHDDHGSDGHDDVVLAVTLSVRALLPAAATVPPRPQLPTVLRCVPEVRLTSVPVGGIFRPPRLV